MTTSGASLDVPRPRGALFAAQSGAGTSDPLLTWEFLEAVFAGADEASESAAFAGHADLCDVAGRITCRSSTSPPGFTAATMAAVAARSRGRLRMKSRPGSSETQA